MRKSKSFYQIVEETKMVTILCAKCSDNNFHKVVFDTCDEINLLGWILLTCGLIFLLVRKRSTRHSKIHFLFQYIDFFEPMPCKECESLNKPFISEYKLG